MTPHRHPLRLALLALLLGCGACNRHTQPDAAPNSSTAPAAAPAIVGQWRNVDGTWRFQADGTFWFMGGTTIQMNPSGLNVPKTDVLQGTYQVHGTNLHLTLKQHTPTNQECVFQIDGRKLTIDGKVYDLQ